MDKLSEQEVRHIGHLARIALTDEEVGLFQRQLTEVIEYNMSLLEEVDVDGVVPTAQTTGLVNVWEHDESKSSLSLETALSQAPMQHDGQFQVSKVLDEG